MKHNILAALAAIFYISFGAMALEVDKPGSNDKFALVKISVANMRTNPGHARELCSQVIMGTPVKLLEKDGDWYKVQSPDGYTGWIVDNSLQTITTDTYADWRKAPRLVMTANYQIRLYTDPTTNCMRSTVTDLVNGCIVEGPLETAAGRVKVALPDGRTGWGDAASFTPAIDWADQTFDAGKILTMAYSMEGQPYLWGGTSTKSLDCSGLSKVSYFSNGIMLMRDASQQARTGTRIEAADWRSCKPGDLLFFGNPDTGKVTHVAIYDHDGNYVHSSGRVKRNSVDPQSAAYLTTPFLHAVRIQGNEGSTGITRVIDHPWYFK